MFWSLCFIFFVSTFLSPSLCGKNENLVDNFDLYNCQSVDKNYIVSRYLTDGFTARAFCLSHNAVLPEFTSNAEISNVFDCLNQDYTGDLKELTFVINVSYLSGGQQKLVFGDEDIDQSFWNPADPNGDCVLPLSSNICCARLTQNSNNNGGIVNSLRDSDVECSLARQHFLCQVNSSITILGDECSLGVHSCSHTCTDDFLGYTCSCPAGFRLGSDQHTCEDIDECIESQVLLCTQACVNVEGSYECECFDGYSPGGRSKACRDDDECALGTSTCDLSIQSCVNTDGGFRCDCVEGFEAYANTCIDIDECLENNDNCPYDCVNTNGSFYCICPDGFQIGPSSSCEDVDECSIATLKTCEQTCSNIIGSFFCSCHDGFVPQNSTHCEDIDECEETNEMCEHDCVNTDGSFFCTCQDGYSVNIDNTASCVDNDECTMGTHTCNVNAEKCVNSDGSFQCVCLQGYHQANLTESCLDIDECEEYTNTCNQTCVNTEGAFYCACSAGFQLGNNSRDCLDIDECKLTGATSCSQVCVNLFGSYQCQCFDGYVLNGNETCVKTCDCSCKDSSNAATEADVDAVVKELIVPRTELSLYTRAKTSAPDTRTSAQSIGYFGLTLMVGFCAFIFVLDFNHLISLLCPH